jgi:hypothetical protein
MQAVHDALGSFALRKHPRRAVAAASGATVLVAITFLITFVRPAFADILCDSGSGGYTDNAIRNLALQHIYQSAYYSDHDYIARRREGDGTIRWEKYQAVSQGDEPGLTFVNSVDAHRYSQQQRAGYTFATWSMEQYSLGGC